MLRSFARTVWNKPAFAITVVLIMALGTGGNTAMFTVIRSVLLKPLAYRDPDSLVDICTGTPERLREMQVTARSFTGIAAYTGNENLTLGGGSEPEVVRGVNVSAGFLEILGVDPKLGRDFLPQEDAPGGVPVAMISYDLWQRHFAGDSHITNKTADLDGVSYSIVGVLPPNFQFPAPGIDVWRTQPSEWSAIPPESRKLSPYLTIFARLKPGINTDQASAEAEVIHRQYAAAHPARLDARLRIPVRVTPMKDGLVANVRSMLWMLFAAVGFVLLIACANVACLLLVRAAARSREFAVRAALGATRARLIRQLLAESVLLSCAGGVLGVLLAIWTLHGISALTVFHLPRAQEIHFDWATFAFAAGLSVLTGLLFGLAPGVGASRPDLIAVLRTSGQAASGVAPRHGRFNLTARAPLVGAQIALSIILLIGAALLMKSVSNLRGVDPGFNPAHLLTMRIALPPARYSTPEKRQAFYDELIRRVEASPGIRSAAVALSLPMMSSPGTPVQDAAKPPLRLNERQIAGLLITTPDYFATMQIPLRRGRVFNAQDLGSSQRVAVIDEDMVRLFWPSYPAGVNPIGQRLFVGGVNPHPAEIVGIVANVHQALERNPWAGSVYTSLAQNTPPAAMIVARTAGEPLRFTRTVQEKIHSLDRDQPVADVRTMDELIEGEVGQRRLVLMLLGTFAGVALLLALVGIYGVISYSVTQRVHEIGIRRALGAQSADIAALVMSQGLGLAAAGIVVGIGGAVVLTRVMKSLLFQVSATDPATFAGIAALFLLVALAASYIPARRATRVDPMSALRE
jgi:putative ABC transport system permease protein